MKKTSGVACDFVSQEMSTLIELLSATQAKDILSQQKALNVNSPELEIWEITH